VLRELRAEDAEAVAAVIRAADPSRGIDAEEVRSWLSHAALDPDEVRVLELDGEVVGYVDLLRSEEIAHVDPNGGGHEDTLLEWAETRARERGAEHARVHVSEHNAGLADSLRARGYERVRTSFEMVVDLDDERPAEPGWPDGIEVRTYRHPQDEQATYEAQEEAFRDAWDYRPTPIEQWREFQLRGRGFDPDLWLLAWEGDELAAVCLAFPERVGDPELGWVSILGVRRPWRRRGLGEALLRRAFRELHARGLRRVGLGVDAESPTGATRLYERAGMRVAVRSETWSKRL
jgi:mycothiol synthase